MLIPKLTDHWQELIASGQIIPATGDGDVVDEAPADYGIDASGELRSIRAEER